MPSHQPEVIWSPDFEEARGAVWLPAAGALLVCDTTGGRIVGFQPEGGKSFVLAVGGRPSFVVPTHDGHLLFGTGRELQMVDTDGDVSTRLRIETPHGIQIQDATVDAMGRLWIVATPEDIAKGGGTVFRYNDERMIPAIFDVALAGAPALTADCRTLYHVDTAGAQLRRYAVTRAGALSNGEKFISFEEGDGRPVAATMDCEDRLWVALAGSRVSGDCLRYYSRSGDLLEHVDLPGRGVTGLSFGGKSMRHILVTTVATEGGGGSLLAFQTDVPGVPLSTLRLSSGTNLGLVEEEDH